MKTNETRMSYERTREKTPLGDPPLQRRLPPRVAERDRAHADAHAAAIAATGSGPASEAIGTAINIAAMKPARTAAAAAQPHGGEAADDRADRAARRDDPPVARAVEVLPEDHRAEHDERREAEVRDGEADDRRAHPGARRHLAQAVAKLVTKRCAAALRAPRPAAGGGRTRWRAKLTASIANT